MFYSLFFLTFYFPIYHNYSDDNDNNNNNNNNNKNDNDNNNDNDVIIIIIIMIIIIFLSFFCLSIVKKRLGSKEDNIKSAEVCPVLKPC